ncbi:hypothetical protein GCM10017668_51060 [Streptomyces tuirus]|uniref:Uncharacterized protein n=1 Tax=Streptomyces tuirus TaxID=68278 RepID=A0A7G1NJ68_9ACTN|nr:hypothetical protein GCM10017668_51060 [Streptomyces tuirus]
MCLWRDFTFRQPGPVTSRHDKALADHAVTVRCPVAEDGSVPDADDVPGNVAAVAGAYGVRALGVRGDRNASCASAGPLPTRRAGILHAPIEGVARRASVEGGGERRAGVRGTTHHLVVSCEAYPQICAPALVGTHQRQLTGTCKLFGMARNRNTGAPRLVVIT